MVCLSDNSCNSGLTSPQSPVPYGGCRRNAEPRLYRKRRRPSPTALLFICLQLAPCICSEKAYPLGCSQRPPSYYDYENYAFPPTALPVQSVDDFLLTRRLGTGKFSDVFEAVDVEAEKSLPGNKHPSVRSTGNQVGRAVVLDSASCMMAAW